MQCSPLPGHFMWHLAAPGVIQMGQGVGCFLKAQELVTEWVGAWSRVCQAPSRWSVPSGQGAGGWALPAASRRPGSSPQSAWSPPRYEEVDAPALHPRDGEVDTPAAGSRLGKHTSEIIRGCIPPHSHEFLKSSSSVRAPHPPSCWPQHGRESADVGQTYLNLEDSMSDAALFCVFLSQGI